MSKRIILGLFRLASIKTFDQRPSDYDIKIIDPSFYDDVLNKKTLGFGEAYMSNKFTTPNLELLLTKLSTLNKLSFLQLIRYLYFTDYFYFINYYLWKLLIILDTIIRNPQTILRSKVVAEEHYNLPPILYQKMLDKNMLYSCAYWKDVDTLDQAQIAKANLIIQKLKIRDGDSILEVGSGFGYVSFAIATQYPNSKVLGISISEEQVKYCQQRYMLPNLKFKLQDYRELKENSFNKIYSVGFFEHTGEQNYDHFFNLMYGLLKNNGIMLLHTIVKHRESHNSDPWFDKYIFRGGYLPSMGQVLKVTEKGEFRLADIQEFGFYYARTLQVWLENFEGSFEELQNMNPTIFTNKFKRMWEFYLVMSKVGFNTRSIHLTQFVFTKNAVDVYCR